jgi:preprotein translocase subunit SecG
MTGIGKITTGVAIVFMLTSLTLAYLSSETARDSVVRDLKPAATSPALPEKMLLTEEVTEEETPEITPAELEQKEAPPIDSSSGN